MITILMPIYNGIEFIDESIKTIIYQNYENWELIVGINGHEKESAVYKIAKEYEKKDTRIKVIDYYYINGKSNTLNEMLKESRYEWISLLDVDDKWLPNKLSSQVPYITNYDVIGTNCKYFGDMNIVPKLPLGDLKNFNFFNFNPIINSSCLIKKSLCYWNFKEDGVEDYDLWLSLWKKNKKFFNVPSIEVFHRVHNNSAFNAKGNNLKVENLKKYYST